MGMKYIGKTSLLLILLTLSVSARAYDTKVYSAAFCESEKGFEDSFHYGVSSVRAIHNHYPPHNIICPIISDSAYSKDRVQVIVYVKSNDRREQFSCALWSKTRSGVTVEVDSATTTYNVPSNLILTVEDTAWGGYLSIICGVPSGGEIYGYRVIELGATDGNN